MRMRRSAGPGMILALLVLTAAGAAAADTLTPRQNIRLGDERRDLGNFVGAAFQYQRAVDKEPENLEALLRLADAYTEAGREYKSYLARAEEVFDRIRTLVGPENVEYRSHYVGFLLGRWEVDEALAAAKELTEEMPGDCQYVTLLAQAERAKGLWIQESEGIPASLEQLKMSESTYREAMEMCPDDPEPVHGLARALDSQKRYQEAVDLYREYRDRYPKRVEFLRGYAVATFNARDWKASADALAELLRTDPQDRERLMYISALRKLGRMEEAEEQGRIHKSTAAQYHGPVQRLPIDDLREELGIRQTAESAVAALEAGDCEGAVALWNEAKVKVRERLDDPDYGDAAEELLVWVDRRVLYAESKCK